LLLKIQPSQATEPSSMVMTPVCRPLLEVKLVLVKLKKDPKPWMTPSGVPAKSA